MPLRPDVINFETQPRVFVVRPQPWSIKMTLGPSRNASMKHESIVAEGHAGAGGKHLHKVPPSDVGAEERWVFTVLAVATVAHISLVVLIARWIFG